MLEEQQVLLGPSRAVRGEGTMGLSLGLEAPSQDLQQQHNNGGECRDSLSLSHSRALLQAESTT